MIELTAEQRLELQADVPRAIDPFTRTKYVLVKEDVYERLEALLVPDRLTVAEQQAALHAAGLRAGWTTRRWTSTIARSLSSAHEYPAWRRRNGRLAL
jgi:hypothetical protein